MMRFSDLGDLPLILIAEALGQDKDTANSSINALVQVNRALYHLLNPVLYRHNAQYSGSSALRWGVVNGLEGTVRLGLEYGSPIHNNESVFGEDDVDNEEDANEKEELSLVCIAAENGHSSILKLLLEHGVSPDCGYSACPRVPVSIAIHRSHDSIFTMLVEHGADMNPEDDPPLYPALRSGSLENVKKLLNAGADLERFEENTGLSAVEGAARMGNQALFELLVFEQRLNPYDCNGNTVLDIAARAGQVELAKYFLCHGLDPEREDEDGRTAIYFAAMNGHLEIVHALLDAGVNADKPDVNGTTPLSAAVKASQQGVAVALLNHNPGGADPQSVDFMGRTPLYWAVHCGEPALAELLLHRDGVDSNFQAQYNHTYLALAASNGNLPVVNMLLARGADPNIRDFFGRTPLIVAASEGRTDVIKALLTFGHGEHGEHGEPREHGDVANATDNAGQTALFSACEQDHLGAVEVLLKHGGADANKTNKHGQTPICRAAEIGHLRIVEFLLQVGANPGICDSTDKSPMTWASEKGHVDVVNELQAREIEKGVKKLMK